MVSKAITPTAAASSSPVIMFGCPSRSLIKPCLCNDLVKGLEIFCEGLQPIKLKSVLEHLEMNEKIIVYMKIKNTYMPTLPDELFGLIRIRHLMIHNCHLGTMKQSTFSQTGEEIESLDLSKNQFTKIPKALGVLINLVSLNLNYNRIESIESNAFEGLRSLLRLFLFGNKIHTIHPHAFIGIAFNVTRINLGGNHLSSIPSDALQSLKSIQRLQLHENKIHRIQRKHFHRLRNLDNLDVINLAGNLLQSLDANAFYDLKALNSIDLEMNRISTIDPMAFNGLQDSLEWLKLDSNELAEVPTSALNLLTKLRELDLRNNFIEKIHTESFRNFGSKIKFLYLQKNRIDFIANDSFQNLSSIEWLYLNSNQLKHLPKRLFETIIERNLTILDLHDNPLICDCEIDWYRRWIESNDRNQQLSHVWKETKCFYANTVDENENWNANEIDPISYQSRELPITKLPSMVKCEALVLTFHFQLWFWSSSLSLWWLNFLDFSF